MKPANSLFAACGTTIFETMSRLAASTGAINLGQGFPEGLEPAHVIERAAQATAQGPHQYPPLMGLPVLREAVAEHERRCYGLDIDEREVLVTLGATEALAACFLGLIEPGDEVVVIEPLYDSYLPMIRRAGGVPRSVRLCAPDWHLPREELAAAFSDKTKLLVLNSPANPCGKVFDAEDLAFIAGLLNRFDAMAVCDEVYEHLVFDGHRHIPLMAMPGMRERCLKIGSAGKMFSLTGWKVGWIVGAPEILAPVVKAHQFLTFTIPPNLQAAVAWGLDHARAYCDGLADQLTARRDRLAEGLRRIGFVPLPVQGSYFLTVDFRPLGFHGHDEAFCRHLAESAGVAAIPVSAFYADHGVDHFIRFCFAKADETIDQGLERLEKFFAGLER